jgi:hypothetical protein
MKSRDESAKLVDLARKVAVFSDSFGIDHQLKGIVESDTICFRDDLDKGLSEALDFWVDRHLI